MRWSVLLLSACVEYGVNSEKPAPEAPEPEGAPVIRVEPTAIDFGELPLGDTSAPVTVTVTNDGDSPLGLDPLALEAPTAPFSVTNLGSTLLDAGASTTFTVSFLSDVAGEAAAEVLVGSNDPATPVVPVALTAAGVAGDIAVDPVSHDFGTLEFGATDAVDVWITNEGVSALVVSDVRYETTGTELTMDLQESVNGPLPWTLDPGEARIVRVDYAPIDDVPDEGFVVVTSNDPDEPSASGQQLGNARAWEGFSTGWYIVDDGTNYETTSNPSRVVDHHGDIDGYWYEPSGVHAMLDSVDIAGDYAILHDYIVARAGAPTPVTGPLSFRTSSSVPSLTYASYSYVLCDFWIDAGDDPNLYEVSAGVVDDGILLLLNGEQVGNLILSETGRWTLTNAVPGAVNTLVVILMDNAQVDKYLYDLAFYRDGVIVSG